VLSYLKISDPGVISLGPSQNSFVSAWDWYNFFLPFFNLIKTMLAGTIEFVSAFVIHEL